MHHANLVASVFNQGPFSKIESTTVNSSRIIDSSNLSGAAHSERAISLVVRITVPQSPHSNYTHSGHGARYSSHVDGGDKLKYYGFPYWLEIDGWSRKIISLCVVESNNDPVITARIWLASIRRLQTVPVVLMSDAGSENVLVHTLQSFLRRDDDDPMAAQPYMVVTSPNNQRAEAMNRIIRERVLDLFLTLFGDLEDGGYDSPSARLMLVV